ncbi:MAG TPA: hypothetical protein VIK86_02220, partial [Candidatus Paceibacterota bacterium]
TKTTESYIDKLKLINKLPFIKAEIYYSDNTWDFSPYTTLNISNSKLRFKFKKVNESFRDEAKKYILVKLLEKNNKIQSLNRNLQDLRLFFNYLEDNHFYNVKDINSEIIGSYLKLRKEQVGIITYNGSKSYIKIFYKYYAANYEDLFSTEIKMLLNIGNSRAKKAIQVQNKTPDIPSVYFDKFLSTIINIINSEEDTNSIKAIACVYLILSQTGLRISEVLALETDALQPVTLYNGEKVNYLKYKTWKRDKGNNIFSFEKTYVNELTKKGYTSLLSIYKAKREEYKLNYLYMGGKANLDSSMYPISSDSFEKHRKKFFSYINKYIPTVNLLENSQKFLTTSKVDKLTYVTCINKNAKTLTYPSTKQFRVHVCSELYKKGVHLKYIQKFMGHLTEEMQGYYIRTTKKDPQESMDFTLKTLENIVTGNTKLLGANSNGLSDKLQEFIKVNKYNVETDMKAIVEHLSKGIPIRQKTGGVCIKSSMLRECSMDAKTNEFYCAYGVCPNIFHFYYMANISYRQTKELVETININKDRGLMRQAQKEINMLNTLIDKKLLPELGELKNVVNKKGTEFIFMEYPDLQDIVQNLDSIYQEVEAWKLLKS